MAASRSLCISSSGRRVLTAGWLVLLLWWCEIPHVQQDSSGASHMDIGPNHQVLKGNRHTQKRSWRDDGLLTAISWQSDGWVSWATQRVLLALILVETTGYVTTNDEVKHTMLRVGDVLSLGGRMAVWWSALAAISNRRISDSQDPMYQCHSPNKNKDVLARLQLSTTTLSRLDLQIANNKAEAVASTACC